AAEGRLAVQHAHQDDDGRPHECDRPTRYLRATSENRTRVPGLPRPCLTTGRWWHGAVPRSYTGLCGSAARRMIDLPARHRATGEIRTPNQPLTMRPLVRVELRWHRARAGN